MELVLGTAQLDGRYGKFRQSFDASNSSDLIEAASLQGFSALDTAPAYEGVENYLGQVGWEGKLHTKVGPSVSPLDSLQSSLAALKREAVDVLYFHDPGVLGESRRDFRDLRAELPRYKANLLGVSIYTPEEMRVALEVPELEAIQIPLNVADGRFDLSLLQQAKRQGVRIYARSVFLQGLLLQEAKNLPVDFAPLIGAIQEMSAVAAESHRSMVEVAIGWVRSLPGIYGIVLGAETPRQIEELGQAFGAIALNDAELASLRGVQITDSALLDPRRW